MAAASFECMSDQELMASMKAGYEGAFAFICGRHTRYLFIYAYSITKDEEVAKDMVEESLAALWEKRTAYKTSFNIGGYLYAVVKQRSILHQKRLRQRKISEQAFTLRDPDSLLVDPIRLIIYRELKRIFKETMYSLPERQQAVAEAILLEDRSHKEIASELGITEESSRQYLVIARRKIIKKLKGL